MKSKVIHIYEQTSLGSMCNKKQIVLSCYVLQVRTTFNIFQVHEGYFYKAMANNIDRANYHVACKP